METIQYKEEHGEVYFQEGFEEELRGKTIEEQIHCYCCLHSISHYLEIRGYYDRDYRTMPAYIKRLHYFSISDNYLPVVREGIVVGFSTTRYRYNENGDKEKYQAVYMPYECFCYDYDKENNGAGYKTTYRNKYLICLPYTHDLW